MNKYFMPVDGKRLYEFNRDTIHVSREFETTPDEGITLTEPLGFKVKLSVGLDQYGKHMVFVEKLWVELSPRERARDIVYSVRVGDFFTYVVNGKCISEDEADKFVIARDWSHVDEEALV